MNETKKMILIILISVVGMSGVGFGSYYFGQKSAYRPLSQDNNLDDNEVIIETNIESVEEIDSKEVSLSKEDLPKSDPSLIVVNEEKKIEPVRVIEAEERDVVSEPIVYSQFQDVSASNYLKNPIFYLNKKVKLTNITVRDFLGAGDKGGLDNYIQVGSNDGDFVIKVENNADYQSIVSRLAKSDPILVYGIGLPSQSFSTIGGGKMIYPVLTAVGMTNCSYTDSVSCVDAMGLNIFGGDRGSWHDVVSASDNNHGTVTNSFGIPGSKIRVKYTCNVNREDILTAINIKIKPSDPGSASEILVADNVTCPVNKTLYFSPVDSPTRAYFLWANSVGAYTVQLESFY